MVQKGPRLHLPAIQAAPGDPQQLFFSDHEDSSRAGVLSQQRNPFGSMISLAAASILRHGFVSLIWAQYLGFHLLDFKFKKESPASFVLDWHYFWFAFRSMYFRSMAFDFNFHISDNWFKFWFPVLLFRITILTEKKTNSGFASICFML